MDGSSMDLVTTGDIENQQHNPKWFVDHKHMLRSNQEEESNKLGFVILKVSSYARQPPIAFSPQGLRFGLHNRENLNNNELETSKLATAMQYGLLGEKWVHFCNAIIDDPKAMLACYGLLDEVTTWTDEQIKHVLALDALFLATYIDIQLPKNERRLWTPHMLLSLSQHAREKTYNNWIQMEDVHNSLHYVENQIPLVLIDKVVDYICNSIDSSTCEGDDLIQGIIPLNNTQSVQDVQFVDYKDNQTINRSNSQTSLQVEIEMQGEQEIQSIRPTLVVTREGARTNFPSLAKLDGEPTIPNDDNSLRSSNDSLRYQERSINCAVMATSICFIDTSFDEAFNTNNSSPFDERTHIFGATYIAICGCRVLLTERTWGSTYIRVPSATKMEQSGIKIVGIVGPLCKMSYKKKCLSLPKMRIYDSTFSFIRNMAWYEMKKKPSSCVFHDYILFMSDLIKTLEDLDLLIKYGVIENCCGIKGFEMWMALEEGLNQITSSSTHHKMKEEIVSRCRLRRYRLWSEFKITFCSKPWVVLSTIAVTLVTVATLVQTYIAIIGSNEMKPKFP